MKESIQRAKVTVCHNVWQALRQVNDLSQPFSHLLQGAPNVKSFLKLLRKELLSSSYQKRKQQSDEPQVLLLHSLCMASYAEPNLLEPYLAIGKAMREKVGRTEDLLQPGAAGVRVSDRTLGYLFSHPKAIIQAYLSTKTGQLIPGLHYDPKLILNNVPGKLIDLAPDIRLIYTPTPTRSNEILPEAHGLLQAMQNGQHHYRGWLYINLQDLTCPDEMARSKNIMRLNEQYPDTFFGITLAQDEGIYLHEPKKALLDYANFTLNSPYGYYFHAKTDEEKERWLAMLERLIHLAMDVAKNQVPGQDRHSVFCDLVTLGIIEYVINKMGRRPMLVNASCKESIDRGGKMNALLYWAKMGSSELEGAFFCLHARALCVRGRQIKARRLEEARKVFTHMSHDELTKFLKLVK